MFRKFNEQFGLIGIACTVFLVLGVSLIIDLHEAKDLVEHAGVFAPFIFIFLKTLTIVAAPISGGPLYPLVGLFFGFWPGIAYVALGDLLGYTIAFFISRRLGRARVEKYFAGNEKGILGTLVDLMGTPKGFFQACLMGFPLPELLSYAAGLSRLSYWKFVLILWPASTAVSGVLVFMGSTLAEPRKTLYLIPFVGLICVALGGFLVLNRLKEQNKS